MGGLSQKFAGFKIENSLVRGAAIPANQVSASRQAMLDAYVEQLLILSLFCRVEDDRDVHHDIDEQAFGSNKGSEIFSPILIAKRQRSPCLDHDLVLHWVMSELVPSLPGREEEKT